MSFCENFHWSSLYHFTILFCIFVWLFVFTEEWYTNTFFFIKLFILIIFFSHSPWKVNLVLFSLYSREIFHTYYETQHLVPFRGLEGLEHTDDGSTKHYQRSTVTVSYSPLWAMLVSICFLLDKSYFIAHY